MSKVYFEQIMDYSPENKTVFSDLVDMCAKRQIVPYIGAGMSAFARYVPILKDRHLFPTWNDLIAIKYHATFPSKKMPKNPMDAAEKIEKNELNKYVRLTMGGNLKEKAWTEILEEAKNQAISVIPKLFCGPIVTTNYDQIIEKVHKDTLSVFFPHKLDLGKLEKELLDGKRFVYKIHGCVSDPENIILTKTAYGNVYKRSSEFVQSLISFFQSFQFLFLGCSLGVVTKTKDRYMELWERLLNSGTRHFAIIDCSEEQLTKRRKELETRNIRPIFYKSGQYASVKIILDRLLENVKEDLPNFSHNENSYIDRESGKHDFDLGYGNLRLANYGKASEHVEKSISILEQRCIETAINLLKNYCNRGITSYEHHKYEKAIEEFDRCIKIGEQMRIEGKLSSEEGVVVERELVRVYMNRAVVYDFKNKHDDALSDKTECIEIWERMKKEGILDDENNLAKVYMNRGVTYKFLNKYKEAQDDFKTSINIWDQMKKKNKVIDKEAYASALTLMNNKLLEYSSLDLDYSKDVKAIINNRK